MARKNPELRAGLFLGQLDLKRHLQSFPVEEGGRGCSGEIVKPERQPFLVWSLDRSHGDPEGIFFLVIGVAAPGGVVLAEDDDPVFL